MREKSTINNLKLIVAKKLKMSRGNIRLLTDDSEPTGHTRLMDKEIVDGDILEAREDSAGD